MAALQTWTTADPQTFYPSSSYYPCHDTSMSTNYPYCDDYDVFINHRGTDVKNSFASHLYHRLISHGLHPFLDREVLQKGEYLDPQIEGAIRSASVHIAIFSPGYAESRWCMDELLLILNKPGHTILPIFYNVKPYELRWTGRYAQALSNHEHKGRYDCQRIEDWRKAFAHVSTIIGFELEAYNGDEGKLLNEVVQCVLKKRGNAVLNVAEVKVEERKKNVLLQFLKKAKAQVARIVGLNGASRTRQAPNTINGLDGASRTRQAPNTNIGLDGASRTTQAPNTINGLDGASRSGIVALDGASRTTQAPNTIFGLDGASRTGIVGFDGASRITQAPNTINDLDGASRTGIVGLDGVSRTTQAPKTIIEKTCEIIIEKSCETIIKKSCDLGMDYLNSVLPLPIFPHSKSEICQCRNEGSNMKPSLSFKVKFPLVVNKKLVNFLVEKKV